MRSICIWLISFDFCRRTDTRPWGSLLIKANGTPIQAPNACGIGVLDPPLTQQITTTTLYVSPRKQPPVLQRHPSTQASAVTHAFHQVSTHAFMNMNGKPHTRFSCVTVHHPRECRCLFPIRSVKRCSSTCDIASHSPHSRSRYNRVKKARSHTSSGTVPLAIFSVVKAKVSCHLPLPPLSCCRRRIKHARTDGLCLNFKQIVPQLLSTASSTMSPTFLSFQIALIISCCSFLLFLPSTTAWALPFTTSNPKAHTCLTFKTPLDITSLKVSDGATCALYSYVA